MKMRNFKIHLTVFVLTCMEFKPESRSAKVRYHVAMFLLCCANLCFSTALLLNAQPHRKDDIWAGSLEILWIFVAVLCVITGSWNHLMLIYHTIRKVYEPSYSIKMKIDHNVQLS